jgi:hypothetical protein
VLGDELAIWETSDMNMPVIVPVDSIRARRGEVITVSRGEARFFCPRNRTTDAFSSGPARSSERSVLGGQQTKKEGLPVWRIVSRLYLGDRKDARDRDMLAGVGITHIVNCAEEVPCWYRKDFRYFHLKLTDPDPEFHEYIETCSKFIHRGRKAGAVLVHCAAGLSRSPSVILAYLCWRGKSLEDALEVLRRGVGEANQEFIEPDASFLEQIDVYFEDR